MDAIIGHNFLSFLDVFLGYNQIPMYMLDTKQNNLHHLGKGFFCYNVMPFDLKHASTMYQWLVTRIFGPLLGHIDKVYIDDMLVKNKQKDNHPRNLTEVLALLRGYDIMFNLEKCAYGVLTRHFLGHLVTTRGIKANSWQIKAL